MDPGDRYRVATIMVNKNDTEDVQWDFSEFADWEVGALLKYVADQEEVTMYVGFEPDEEEGEEEE